MSDRDEELLKELRERYDYATSEWTKIRQHGAICMRYLGGDSFALDPKAREAREKAKRPIVDCDELSQYVNQLLGKAKQNKRGVQVTPVGFGANDQTARFREGKIRDIEYQSNAQQAYSSMLESAAQRGYGALRITAKYAGEEGWDQDLCIEEIQNPDALTPDPDDFKQDGSRMRYAFYEETRSVRDFKKDFPGAKITDFSSEYAFRSAWVPAEGRIKVAEYWTREKDGSTSRLLMHDGMEDDEEAIKRLYKGEIPSAKVRKKRERITWKVRQYLTNGFEILDSSEWPGQTIPFVTCCGKILWIDEGAGPKRKFLALPSLALSLQMLYAYYRTQQAEMAGMIPKVPVIGYLGQFDGIEDDWTRAPHEPLAYLQARAKTEETGDQILPLPTRLAYDAAAQMQALELCAEGARRAIQAAIGGSFLPTQAQRRNEKSGVALKQMEDTQDVGTFHFIDHYDESLTQTWKILDECIPHNYDTVRETSIRNPDDTTKLVRINDPNYQEDGQQTFIDAVHGRHDVTISVGPKKDSEREDARETAKDLLGNKELMMFLGPQRGPKFAAKAVKVLDLGVMGDEMVDLLDPKEGDPSQIAGQAQQLAGENQQLKQELQQASFLLNSKKMEIDSKERITQWQIASDDRNKALDREVKLAVAELSAKVDRMALFLEERARLGDQSQQEADRAHEVGMAAMQHGHAKELGAQAAQSDSALSGQEHGQSMEQADQGQAHALEQGQQAADLAPEPAEDGE